MVCSHLAFCVLMASVLLSENTCTSIQELTILWELFWTFGLFWTIYMTFFCVCTFSCFWTYVWLHVFFVSLFSFYKIIRFLLITSTAINTKLTCIITDFTVIILLIAKILLANIDINLTCFDNAFTIYLTSAPNNDITRRVVMFP